MATGRTRNATDGPPAGRDSRPLDVETMRATASRLIGEAASLLSADELEALTLQLRGHMMVAIPDIERAAFALPEDDVPRACALACVGEARMRLDLAPDHGLAAELKHAQRLARSVNALCDHHHNLGVAPS
ncbi:DUF6415 family natural product biosynthesis protein [Streptomyces sp. NPDC057620]|uniref:DUF6415 family natural product biosynthesis protein n=1 Tax=Streptomyces sp. NPDC057620 TaxID=3346185 RepID=UPI0036BB441F